LADYNLGGSCLKMSAEIADSQMAEVVAVARLSKGYVGPMMVVMMMMMMRMKQSSFVSLFEYEG
jgi:hypothetical protein